MSQDAKLFAATRKATITERKEFAGEFADGSQFVAEYVAVSEFAAGRDTARSMDEEYA